MNPTDFPGAELAVELCEQLRHWDMYRRTAAAEGLPSLVGRMRQSAETSMLQMLASGADERAEVVRKALEQWDHPNFIAYLRKKLYGKEE